MSKIESSAGKALYEQQETKLSQQSAAFIELLTKRGILGDSSIDDDRVRQAKKEKRKACIITRFSCCSTTEPFSGRWNASRPA